MTDTTLTPGSEWLLPVTVDETRRSTVLFFAFTGYISVNLEDLPSLIPASRLADLEAEVARLQAHVDRFEALYEAARHDLGKEQVRAVRLQRALETIWVVSDQTDVIQAANDALSGKEAEQ